MIFIIVSKKSKSIKFRIVVIILVTYFILMGFIVYYSRYSKEIVLNQAIDSYNDLLSLHVQKIDSSLDNQNRFLLKKVIEDYSINKFKFTEPYTDEYMYTLNQIMLDLKKDSAYQDMVDSFFIYYPENDKLIISLNPLNVEDRLIEKDNMISQALEKLIVSDSDYDNRWNVLYYDNQYYLIHIIRSDAKIFMGETINIDYFLQPLEFINTNDNVTNVIVSSDDSLVTSANVAQDEEVRIIRQITDMNVSGEDSCEVKDLIDGRDTIIIKEDLKSAGLTFAVMLPKKDILKNLPDTSTVSYLLIAGVIIVVFIILSIISNIILKPLRYLVDGMKKVEKGDIDIRLNENNNSELGFLIHRFNKMVSEISNLKINVYEEKLHAQRAELKGLQSQINPHFFLNILNMVYNLAQLKDFHSIKKTALYMGDYFRYTLKTDQKLVRLKNEIDHTKNYLELQKLRYPDNLIYQISINNEYLDYEIPLLTLQPIVENALIHGFTDRSKTINICVDAEISILESIEYLVISIKDTGAGFTEEVLKDLDERLSLKESNGTHVGLWNVNQRLKIYYGEKAGLRFNNYSKGAMVDIYIPK